jgi:hypothetical protein
LFLLDRTEDLFTPLSCLGLQSLAQHIANTLKMPVQGQPASGSVFSVELDACIQPRFVRLLSQFHSNSQDQGQEGKAAEVVCQCDALYEPMPVVSQLAFRAPFSSCYMQSKPQLQRLAQERGLVARWQRLQPPPQLQPLCVVSAEQESSREQVYTLRKAMFVLSEELGKQVLFEALQSCIVQERGSFVAKKRGTGAELFALVTALLAAPGGPVSLSSSNIKQEGRQAPAQHHSLVAQRHHALLALTVTVIECMQRSAYKQFQVLYHPQSLMFKASYDLRVVREAFLYSLALQQQQQQQQHGNVWRCWEVLLEALVTRKQQQTRDEEHLKGPVDIAHLLGMLTGFVASASQQHSRMCVV